MELEVLGGNNHNQNLIIDYLNIRLTEITPEEIMEYQNIFGKIISENHNDFRYIFSDLLNREDGTTHLLDSIVKYIECVKLLESNTNNLTIINLDNVTFNCLVNYCKEKKIKLKNQKRTALKYKKFKLKILFLIRFFSMYLTNTLILFYSKISLKSNIKFFKTAFISYFDYRSIKDNTYIDPFFYRLQEKYNQDNSKFVVVVILMYNNIWTGLKYINDIKKTRNKNIITTFNLIKPFQLLLFYIKSLNYITELKDDILFSNYSIKYLLKLKLNIEYYSGSKQFSIERYLIINILDYQNFKKIYYPFENFSWEKILCKKKHEYKNKLILIGFQHTSFSLKLMHHFPSIFERDLNIYPDKIYTTGEITRSVLLHNGNFPINLIKIGCALRHQYLEKYISNFNPVFKIYRRVAFAFSYDMSRYDFIINNLLEQFGNCEIEIILKFHPLNKDYCYKLSTLPSNFTIGNTLNWDTIFQQIDVLLYEGNSICIDALANNIPAIYYPYTGNLYNTNQLYYYEWDFKKDYSFNDYFIFILDIIKMNLKSNPNFFKYNEFYVNRYFQKISPISLNKFITNE